MKLDIRSIGGRYAPLGVLVMLGIHGCGAAASMQMRAPGNLDLSKSLPAPTASPFGHAYGGEQASDLVAVETPNLDTYLKAQPQQPTHVQPTQLHAKRAAPVVVASAPVLVADATPVPPSAAPSPLAATDPATDANRYAQRQNKQLEQYRGGDVIVIGASTLLIILLIVVLVLLLVR